MLIQCNSTQFDTIWCKFDAVQSCAELRRISRFDAFQKGVKLTETGVELCWIEESTSKYTNLPQKKIRCWKSIDWLINLAFIFKSHPNTSSFCVGVFLFECVREYYPPHNTPTHTPHTNRLWAHVLKPLSVEVMLSVCCLFARTYSYL